MVISKKLGQFIRFEFQKLKIKTVKRQNENLK